MLINSGLMRNCRHEWMRRGTARAALNPTALNVTFFLQQMAISVANCEAENKWLGKVIHNNLSNKMEYKEKITCDKLPNMKTQEIFPNTCFWEVSKNTKPVLTEFRTLCSAKQLRNLRGSNKNIHTISKHSGHSRLLWWELDHSHTSPYISLTNWGYRLSKLFLFLIVFYIGKSQENVLVYSIYIDINILNVLFVAEQ